MWDGGTELINGALVSHRSWVVIFWRMGHIWRGSVGDKAPSSWMPTRMAHLRHPLHLTQKAPDDIATVNPYSVVCWFGWPKKCENVGIFSNLQVLKEILHSGLLVF